MKLKKFIAKIFNIEITTEYNIENMGIPIHPGEILHNSSFFIQNLSDVNIYIGGIPQSFPEKMEVRYITIDDEI